MQAPTHATDPVDPAADTEPAPRPRVTVILNELEMMLAENCAAFCELTIAATVARTTTKVPGHGEILGRAIAYATKQDPEQFGSKIRDCNVSLQVVPTGMPIPERVVHGEPRRLVSVGGAGHILGPDGRPIGRA